MKRIGTQARRDMEEFLGSKVFLQTFVKVRPNWRQDPEFLAAQTGAVPREVKAPGEVKPAQVKMIDVA